MTIKKLDFIFFVVKNQLFKFLNIFIIFARLFVNIARSLKQWMVLHRVRQFVENESSNWCVLNFNVLQLDLWSVKNYKFCTMCYFQWWAKRKNEIRFSFFVLGKIKTNEKRILFSPKKKNERKTNNEKRTKKRKTFRFLIKKNEKQENPPKNNEKSLSPSKKKKRKTVKFFVPASSHWGFARKCLSASRNDKHERPLKNKEKFLALWKKKYCADFFFLQVVTKKQRKPC